MSLWVEAIGGIAASITTLCWVPQALHIIKTRETAGVSFQAYAAFSAGIAMWLVYGLLIGSIPVIAANSVTLILVLFILGLKLRYSN